MSNAARPRPPRRWHRPAADFKVVAIGALACAVPGCACRTEHAWSYTVGRTAQGQAELVTTGVRDADFLSFLNSRVSHEIDVHGLLDRLTPDGRFWLDDFPLRLDPVPAEWLHTDTSRMAVWFNRFGGRPSAPDVPELLQIVWPDDWGRFPDDPLCDWAVRDTQPLLGDDPTSFPPDDFTSRLRR